MIETSEGNRADDPTASARSARLGLVFFCVYLVIYCGYVGLVAFARPVLDMTPVAGLNVATLYGLLLIIVALLFAVAYGWACRLSVPAASGNPPSDPPSK
jgi:uncharacterized membrane protein (DUF485 family)